MPRCELDLLEPMNLLALHVLGGFLTLELFPSHLQRVEKQAADCNGQTRQKDSLARGVLGLLATTAPGPTRGHACVSRLVDRNLERAILCHDFDGIILVLDPIKTSLKEHRAQLLSNALLPLARRAASPRGVGQHRVVGATDRQQPRALLVRGIHFDEHLLAHERQAEKGRHLVGLRAVRRALAHPGAWFPLLALRPVEHVLLHAWQLASATVDVDATSGRLRLCEQQGQEQALRTPEH
mmetsp:Transcript_72370/g.183090  ORF Transcript_72370/g.183090 Transcript_72370/m.183090 type:complete len:239 (-) Transcript_72370:165-881(-)